MPRRSTFVRWRLPVPPQDASEVCERRAGTGQLVGWAKTFLALTVRTGSRPTGVTGFVVLPRRWVVARSFGWIMHPRRLVRGYERLPQHSESLIT